jgi:hypothetical protein
VAVPACWLTAGFFALAVERRCCARGGEGAIAARPLARRFWHGLRRGEFGLDLLAALSMAGAIVALMFARGQSLEDFVRERARRGMAALLGCVARTATRHGATGLEEMALEAVRPGDRPWSATVDGRVVAGWAVPGGRHSPANRAASHRCRTTRTRPV